ncbi:serine/threonine protein kinase [halophilic archaeon]|nr:serine/threonine protein kinase [halophilic archaeon]
MTDLNPTGDHLSKRRAFLKTVGITMGAVGGQGATAAANGRDDENWKDPDGWTSLQSGPGRTGSTDDPGPVPYPRTAWKTNLGGSMYDVEPVVVDETAYLAVTTDTRPTDGWGYVGAYHTVSGEQEWKRAGIPAPKTPAFEDGTLYFATEAPETDEGGGFFAIDADTGETVWKRTDVVRWTSPVVADGLVYTANDEGAYALDAETGDTFWQVDGVGGIANGSSDGALSYADGTVFFSDGTALNATTGALQWHTNVEPVLGNHVADDERVYYVRTEYVTGNDDDVHVEARSTDDGQVQWTYDPSESNQWDGRLALDDERLYLLDLSDDSSSLRALDAETGAVEWTTPTNGDLRSNPTVADDTVYVGGTFAPDPSGRQWRALVYAVDASTGDKKWVYLLENDDLPISPENPPTASTPVVVDDRLYTVTYPTEATLDYEYAYYSNFYALRSFKGQQSGGHRLPNDVPDDG